MKYISGSMPKKPETKRVEAHLEPDKFDQLTALAQAKQWSNKKMAENIILEYLAAHSKKKPKLT